MSLYLDPSVIVPLFVNERRSEALLAWLEDAKETLAISDLATAEFGAAVSRLGRMGILGDNLANSVLERFDEWRADVAEALEIVPADIRVAARLVRNPRPKLLAPDAIHLAICRRTGFTLVTHDVGLTAVAGREEIRCIKPA